MHELSSARWTIDWIGVGIPFVATLCYIGLTILVLKYERMTRATRAFAVFLVAHVVWTVSSMFWHYTAHIYWNRVLAMGITVTAVSLVYLITELMDIRSHLPLQISLVFGLTSFGLIFGNYVIRDSYMVDGIAKLDFGPGFFLILTGVLGSYAWGIAQLVQRYRVTLDRTFRFRIQYFVLGLVVQGLGGLTNSIPGIGHYPIDVAAGTINAALIAYAIRRYQLLDLTSAARRGMGHSIFTIVIAGAYVLSVVMLASISELFPEPGVYLAVAVMAVVFAVLYEPVRAATQLWVDRIFFWERYDAQKTVEEMSRVTASVLDLQTLGDQAVEKIATAMHINRVMLLMANRLDGSFHLLAKKGVTEEITPHFMADHPVVAWLRDSDGIFRGETVSTLPQFRSLWAHEERELETLGIEWFVPVRFEGELIGILAVGQKLSGSPYLRDEEAALRTLANQLAVAAANARLVTELQHSVAELRQAQEQLVQSEKLSAVGQLVAGVAHELNNPLTTIMGYSELLLSDPQVPPGIANDLRYVGNAAERCSRIVQNLLMFARKQGPDTSWCNINRILEETLSLQEYRCAVENIVVAKDLDPELPDIWADRYQLQQVFLNIMTNAQQAMQATNGGTLTVSSTVVGDRVSVAIRDTGPGISPEARSRIFEPFFTTKDVGEGTGLGLSICYGIVESHGGKITAYSEPDEGAVFVVDLPLLCGKGPRHRSSVAPETPARADNRHILVVDDEEAITSVVRKALEREGFVVDVAENGMAALELLNPDAKKDYDLILSDLKMPGLDGPRLYAHLVMERPGLEKRLIFMTGDTSSSDTMSFLAHCRQRYIAKPFDLGSLRKLVFEALESEQIRRA